jgi:hypothetical protein
MPELPDVEGFKRVLAKSALHKRIDRVVVGDARILGQLSPRTFTSASRALPWVQLAVAASTSWRALIVAAG